MSEYDGAMVSFGGGVNSTAMVIWLVEQGWRGPVVFSDTGAEWPETMCYLRYFEAEYLQPRGLEITRLQGLPWQRYNGGINLIEYCERHAIVPLAGVRFCTAQWKASPLERWRKQAGISTALVGIAAEEAQRAPDQCRPLVDAGIDRRGCVSIIQAAGLDVPAKSGCYICPFTDRARWRLLWERHPELFERAARLEVLATAKAGRIIALDPYGDHTLRQRQAMYEGQIPMWEPETMDGLLAYRPCLCSL